MTPPVHRAPSAPGADAVRWPEQLFVMAGLLVFTGAGLPLLRADGTGENSTIGIVATGMFCLGALALLRVRGVGLGDLLRRVDPLVKLVLLVVSASTLWSVDPQLTVRRAVAVLLYTIFGLYLATRFPLREQPWLIARTLGVAALASLLLAVLVPRYGLMPGDNGQWRGIYLQKNVLGRVMAVAVLAAVLAALCAPKGRRRRLSLGIGALASLVLLRSASVFAVVALGVTAAPVLTLLVLRTRFPIRQGLVVLAWSGLVVGALVAARHSGTLLEAAGRDSNLTGRVPLWISAFHALMDRPLQGYGYGAFWHGWGAPSTEVFLENPWRPPHAHNGPLDLALGVGVIGAGIWVAAVLRCLVRSFGLLVRTREVESVWAFGLTLIIVAYNVTEVTSTGSAFFWALFVAVSTWVHERYRETRPTPLAARRARLTPHDRPLVAPHRAWR